MIGIEQIQAAGSRKPSGALLLTGEDRGFELDRQSLSNFSSQLVKMRADLLDFSVRSAEVDVECATLTSYIEQAGERVKTLFSELDTLEVPQDLRVDLSEAKALTLQVSASLSAFAATSAQAQSLAADFETLVQQVSLFELDLQKFDFYREGRQQRIEDQLASASALEFDFLPFLRSLEKLNTRYTLLLTVLNARQSGVWKMTASIGYLRGLLDSVVELLGQMNSQTNLSDIDFMLSMASQLYAEAYELAKSGRKTLLDLADRLALVQCAFREIDQYCLSKDVELGEWSTRISFSEKKIRDGLLVAGTNVSISVDGRGKNTVSADLVWPERKAPPRECQEGVNIQMVYGVSQVPPVVLPCLPCKTCPPPEPATPCPAPVPCPPPVLNPLPAPAPPSPPPSPAPTPAPDGWVGGSGNLRINVSWSEDTDIDPVVVDPQGFSYGYHSSELGSSVSKGSVSSNGGTWDVDDTGSRSGPSDSPNQENFVWASTFPSGVYKIYLRTFSGSVTSAVTVSIQCGSVVKSLTCDMPSGSRADYPKHIEFTVSGSSFTVEPKWV